MQTFILSLSLCLLGFAVCVITFALAMGTQDEEEEARSSEQPLATEEQFFLHEEPREREPGEVFLLQLQNHVRMEQEAAKAFLDLPNAESLHAPTESPLWH